MRRRDVIAAFARGPSYVLPARAEARTSRLGLLVTGPDAAPGGFLFDALRRGLEERGCREGRNLRVDYRLQAHSDTRSLPAVAAELLELKPDVIVTSTTPPTKAIRDTTRSIPVVMGTIGDPVGSGFIETVARPGGNVE